MKRLVVFTLAIASLASAQSIDPNQIKPGTFQSGSYMMPGAFAAQSTNGALNATVYPGSDIGAQANAAFAAGGVGAHVRIPAGSYTYSTDISIPAVAGGNYELECDPGTTLNYTGSGYGIKMVPAANVNGDAGNLVENCNIVGTPSGQAAFYLYAFSGAKLININASRFSNGAGVLNQGVNTVDIAIGSEGLNHNQYGIHNVGTTAFTSPVICFAANAEHVNGGLVGGNSAWGIYEDGTQSASTGTNCTVGPNQGNTYTTTFENNGAQGNPATGNFFAQLCEKCKIDGSYLEQFASPTNVTLGDSTYQSRSVSVTNSYLDSNVSGMMSTINDANCIDCAFTDDQDDGYAATAAPAQFIVLGSGAVNTTVRNYRASNLTPSNSLIGYASASSPEQGSWKNPASGPPGTNSAFGDLISSQTAPAVGTADGNILLRKALWIPGATAVNVSQLVFTAASPWRIILQGVFVDDATAPNTTALPAYIERSASNNTLTIDAYSTLTFSRGSGGQIQVVNSSAHNVTFIGDIRVLGDNENVAGNTSLDVTGGANFGGPVSAAGVTSGRAAGAGTVGQDVSSLVASGSAVSLATATPANVASIDLTPGDWEVWGNCNFTASGATVAPGAAWAAGINTASATLPTDGSEVPMLLPAVTATTFKDAATIAPEQINLSSGGTAYLVCEATFTAGSVGGYGKIEARRMR